MSLDRLNAALEELNEKAKYLGRTPSKKPIPIRGFHQVGVKFYGAWTAQDHDAAYKAHQREAIKHQSREKSFPGMTQGKSVHRDLKNLHFNQAAFHRNMAAALKEKDSKKRAEWIANAHDWEKEARLAPSHWAKKSA